MEGIPSRDLDRLRRNLAGVLARIAGAAAGAGRNPGDVRLVAVTKSVCPEVAAAVAGQGVLDLGENRPEVVPARALAVGRAVPGVRWHLIGHYQSRKIAGTLGYFSLVHSVHSVDLLERLDRRASEIGRTAPILLQVNVSGEVTKQGFPPDGAAAALEVLERCPALSVQGLMTMAPPGLPPPELRRVFAGLRRLREALATPARPLPELSMGMSDDFEEAVREGATIVRIGSALFEGVAPVSTPSPGG